MSVVFNRRGRRWARLRDYTFPTLRRLTPLAASGRDDLVFLFRTDDLILGRHVFSHGDFEEDVVERAVQALGRLTGREDPLRGRVFVEVGANIGTTLVPALRHFGAARAVAIEPDAENVRMLRCNLILNEVDGVVEVLSAAVSDRPGTVEFSRSPVNSGDHRVASTSTPRTGETAQVEAVTLDEALRRTGVEPGDIGLVWMDTQGHEGHVLAGATATLRAGVPMVTEFWPHGLRASGGFDRFVELAAANFGQMVDLRAADRPIAADDATLRAIAAELGDVHTDLLLLP
jgi:FkbM family methyltransferase